MVAPGAAFTKAEVVRLGGVMALHSAREASQQNPAVVQCLEGALRVLVAI
jgi:hypothetical protein